jgi:glycosyltransferase involved in cell wall biosynthesis
LSKIKWTHIGGGELEEKMKKKAVTKLGGIEVEWMGTLDNCDIKKYYATNKIDIFVNVSRHEGIPVSIMEALSFGIPVLATDVGGVSEIVTDMNGILLPVESCPEKICDAMLKIISQNSYEYRKQIRENLHVNYDAKNNYRKFIQNVIGA